MRKPSQRMQQTGFTVLEASISLLISALLASQAIPALGKLKQRQSLNGVAQTVMTDLQQARSEAVLNGSNVHLKFSSHASGTCYVLHSGPSSSCSCEESGQAVCTGEGQVVKSEWFPTRGEVAIRANVSGLSYSPRQGTTSSTGSIDIHHRNGDVIRHVVSITGRVRSCAPGQAHSGLQTC
ncbi:hypothetical protein C1O66_04740 [Paucibacter aquatile]|uniref:Type II secretion system protein H n=1 Tax=Kinneretia aquatilis TaxID=2070761 RepID=A0A2N8KTY4_9BURK|nr:GspH/FimT family pseudopilin [Paucibacter aquatile]PND36913.1 hypothetical protein C1O66_04740 [Paucibacter aquatile]